MPLTCHADQEAAVERLHEQHAGRLVQVTYAPPRGSMAVLVHVHREGAELGADGQAPPDPPEFVYRVAPSGFTLDVTEIPARVYAAQEG